MRLDAERSSTYRIFAEYRADCPKLQLEKRAAPALKVLLDATVGPLNLAYLYRAGVYRLSLKCAM
jgi:hypothetical protein